MLKGFAVENYRAFARRQEVEIRPLTLFFGWNSGGKSALLRFLPLLSESIKEAGPPIWLAGEVGRRATWPELVCKKTARGNLKFSLTWDEELPTFAQWEIAGDLEGRWQQAKELSIKVDDNDLTLGSEFFEGERTEGLVPWSVDMVLDETLDILRNALFELATNTQWISGVRVRPPRVTTYCGGAPATMQSNGTDALDHLIAAQLRSTADPLLEATGEFFEALGEKLVLDNPIDGVWKVSLRPAAEPQVDVNICDTGEGYAQVLPVLIALARARVGTGPSTLCIEQPELHLHTKAQVELSKILIKTALSRSRPSILVETHSEIMLTSVQLAIARGDISADSIRVYWVESKSDGTSDTIPVDFNDKGQPLDSTLAGAFREAIGLTRELIAAQIDLAGHTK